MLNENIQAMRKARGMSQEELARRLNVVRQTVSKWEKGLSVPDAAMLIKLAQALDTQVNVLLGEAIPEQENREEGPESETIRELAKKLEELNAELARRNERDRKLVKIGQVNLILIALLYARPLFNYLSVRFTVLFWKVMRWAFPNTNFAEMPHLGWEIMLWMLALVSVGVLAWWWLRSRRRK